MVTSAAFPARSAPITPNTTPTIIQMIAAPIASEKVAGRPRLICENTVTCWV